MCYNISIYENGPVMVVIASGGRSVSGAVLQVNVNSTGVSRTLGGRTSGGWARRRRRRAAGRAAASPVARPRAPVPETLQAAQGSTRPRRAARSAA